MCGNSVVLGIPFQLRIDRKLELTTDMHLSVNDSEYIEFPLSQCIPKSQYQKLLTDISAIETEFGRYVAGFMKASKKNVLPENHYTGNLL